MSNGDRVQRLGRPDGNTVAYAKTDGRGPTVAFLGGFRSDMTGTKAIALEDWARRTGRAYLRFDYLGHGQSSGRFEDGTIGRWLDDSLAAIDAADRQASSCWSDRAWAAGCRCWWRCSGPSAWPAWC